MADPDKWTLNLPPGPDCSVGYSSNEFVSEDGSSLPGRENEDKYVHTAGFMSTRERDKVK